MRYINLRLTYLLTYSGCSRIYIARASAEPDHGRLYNSITDVHGQTVADRQRPPQMPLNSFVGGLLLLMSFTMSDLPHAAAVNPPLSAYCPSPSARPAAHVTVTHVQPLDSATTRHHCGALREGKLIISESGLLDISVRMTENEKIIIPFQPRNHV